MKNMGLVTITAVAALSLIGCGNKQKPKPPVEAVVSAPILQADDDYNGLSEGGKYKGASEGKSYYHKSVKKSSARKTGNRKKGRNVRVQSTVHEEHEENLASSNSDHS